MKESKGSSVTIGTGNYTLPFSITVSIHPISSKKTNFADDFVTISSFHKSQNATSLIIGQTNRKSHVQTLHVGDRKKSIC